MLTAPDARRSGGAGDSGLTFTSTAHAKAPGWETAFGAGVVRVKDGQSGRGERIETDAIPVFVCVTSPAGSSRAWEDSA